MRKTSRLVGLPYCRRWRQWRRQLCAHPCPHPRALFAGVTFGNARGGGRGAPGGPAGRRYLLTACSAAPSIGAAGAGEGSGPRVCILGGGFGGLYTAVKLESLIWPRGTKPRVSAAGGLEWLQRGETAASVVPHMHPAPSPAPNLRTKLPHPTGSQFATGHSHRPERAIRVQAAALRAADGRCQRRRGCAAFLAAAGPLPSGLCAGPCGGGAARGHHAGGPACLDGQGPGLQRLCAPCRHDSLRSIAATRVGSQATVQRQSACGHVLMPVQRLTCNMPCLASAGWRQHRRRRGGACRRRLCAV